MKLRSLFLAGLAVMAMASCSNEDDAIVNGGENAAKDAHYNSQLVFLKPQELQQHQETSQMRV